MNAREEHRHRRPPVGASNRHDCDELAEYIQSVRRLADERRSHADVSLIDEEVAALELELAELERQLDRQG